MPSPDMPSWRVSVTLRLVAGCLLAWSALALWAGLVAGSHLDLWSTQAQAQLMRRELERSRDDLARIRQADRDLRAMLRLPDGSAISTSTPSGRGGPLPSDSRNLETLQAEVRETLRSYDELTGYLDQRRALLRATPQGWPAPGRLTSSFGRRASPMEGPEAVTEFHPGLDIANSKGTLILATADGVVRRAGWARGYGRMLLIRHSRRYATLFGHTSKLLVKEGQRVERGQPIALMGTTGRSTGSHLHYEVWLDGRPTNPRRYLN